MSGCEEGCLARGVVNGTRMALGLNYGSLTEQETIGYSRYNALELNLRHSHGPTSILAGYTYSKSVDVSSNLGEQVNPFNVALSEAPSAFDNAAQLRHQLQLRIPVRAVVPVPQPPWRDGRCRG